MAKAIGLCLSPDPIYYKEPFVRRRKGKIFKLGAIGAIGATPMVTIAWELWSTACRVTSSN